MNKPATKAAKPNTLRIALNHPNAKSPTYGTEGAACFDIYAAEPGIVRPGQATIFKTGLHVEVPDGYVMMVYSRSGHGFKDGVRLVNGTGVIDSDYRGEVCVGLRNDHPLKEFVVRVGNRIAQAMIVKAPQWTFEHVERVEDLSATSRGAGGIGSTGR